MQYRIAIREDLFDLIKLDQLFWLERQSMMPTEYRHTDFQTPNDLVESRICDDGYKTFVATDDGCIQGYLVAKILEFFFAEGKKEREGRICDVYVRPEYRRQRIASGLYRMAADWFDHEKCVCEGLTVFHGNPAQSLYLEWGFEPFSVNMRRRRT